jgi:hypothetical protein
MAREWHAAARVTRRSTIPAQDQLPPPPGRTARLRPGRRWAGQISSPSHPPCPGSTHSLPAIPGPERPRRRHSESPLDPQARGPPLVGFRIGRDLVPELEL